MAKELNLLEPEIEISTRKTRKSDPLVDILQQVKDREDERKQLEQGRQQVKQVIEGLLFSTSEPLSLKKIRDVTDQLCPLKPRVLLAIMGELRQEYDSQRRAFELSELEDGYILRTRPEYGKYVELLFRSKRGDKLSNAATEVLAIIAYRQPITRVQVDAIRGVDSSGTVYSLLERGLIECVGRLDAPGRPSLYGTTTNFLKAFGVKKLEDLPHRDSLNKRANKLPTDKAKPVDESAVKTVENAPIAEAPELEESPE